MGGNYEKLKQRATTVRLRTWTLTISIIVVLILYFLVKTTTKQQINLIDFAFLCVVQIVTHFLYFSDGDLFGQKDEVFIKNKLSYNDKAEEVNQTKRFSRLREYCKVEYERQKQSHILNECSVIEITLEELDILRKLDEKEIKSLKQYEFKYETTEGDKKKELSKIVFFSKAKRKRLYNLLFKPLPVEQNHPETIMSAVERNGKKAIRDGSVAYRTQSNVRKILSAIIVGGTLAYVGYTFRDGIGLPEIVQILVYLLTMFSTAVLSFSSGENCSRIYKSRFYLDLANFIDNFNEWDSQTKSSEDKLISEEDR